MNKCRHIFASALILLGFIVLSAPANAYEVKFINSSGVAFDAIESQQYDEAIDQLRAMIAEKSPKMDIQLANLCTALVVSNRLEEAKSACDQAANNRGRYLSTVLNSRGVMNVLQGDFEAAIDDFSLAADKASHPALPHHALWAKVPGMPNRSTPDSTYHEIADLAMQNYAKADKRWAAIRATESESLKAAYVD